MMFKKIKVWFLQKAWPVILKFLIKYEDEIVEFIFKTINEKMDQKRKKQQAEYMSNARDDLEKAKEATDPNIKRQYYDSAVISQGKANSFDEKMKIFNEYLDSLKKEVKEEISQKTSNLKAEDIFETEKEDKFDLKEKTSYLQIEAPDK